jgi:hypothetical protein
MIVRCDRCGRQLFAPTGAQGACPGCGASVGTGIDSTAGDSGPAVASTPVGPPGASENLQRARDARAAEYADRFAHLAGSSLASSNPPSNGWQAFDPLADESEEGHWPDHRAGLLIAGVVCLALFCGAGYWYLFGRGQTPSLAAQVVGAPGAPVRWEYKLTTPTGAMLSTELAVAGAGGWELVFVHAAGSPAGNYDLIFKRPAAGDLLPDGHKAAQSLGAGPNAKAADARVPDAKSATEGAADPKDKGILTKLKDSDLRKFDP